MQLTNVSLIYLPRAAYYLKGWILLISSYIMFGPVDPVKDEVVGPVDPVKDEVVGPVDPVKDEVVGPSGPTTSTSMDKFT